MIGLGKIVKMARGGMGVDEMGEMLAAAGIDVAFEPVKIETAAFTGLRTCLASGGGQDAQGFAGAGGPAGANSGGTASFGGLQVSIIAASINGTGGLIDVSGGAGNPPTASSEGASAGAGAGFVALSSQATGAVWPTVAMAGGPGAIGGTVPQALWTGGSCTSPPKATLSVSAGALSGTCTVVQAGAGCGTGANTTVNVLGGGGTQGTGTINPTWSGGALASCTITSGTSSGYTAATYTSAGNGGDGDYGTPNEYQGW